MTAFGRGSREVSVAVILTDWTALMTRCSSAPGESRGQNLCAEEPVTDSLDRLQASRRATSDGTRSTSSEADQVRAELETPNRGFLDKLEDALREPTAQIGPASEIRIAYLRIVRACGNARDRFSVRYW